MVQRLFDVAFKFSNPSMRFHKIIITVRKRISPLSFQRLDTYCPKFSLAEAKHKQKIAGTELTCLVICQNLNYVKSKKSQIASKIQFRPP